MQQAFPSPRQAGPAISHERLEGTAFFLSRRRKVRETDYGTIGREEVLINIYSVTKMSIRRNI
jgi:hypothetical protein